MSKDYNLTTIINIFFFGSEQHEESGRPRDLLHFCERLESLEEVGNLVGRHLRRHMRRGRLDRLLRRCRQAGMSSL